MGMVEIRNLVFLILGATLAITLANLGLETIRENWLGGVLIFLGLFYIVGGAIYLWAPQGEVDVCEGLSHPSLWVLAPGLTAVFLAPPLE